MQVQKVIQTITKQDIDLDIQEVTLLSREEARNFLKRDQCNLGEGWWLRSAVYSSSILAESVDYDGSFNRNCVDFGLNGIAPALRISNLSSNGLKIGDIIEVGGEFWKVISEDLAWCDHIVGKTAFRKDYEVQDANVYEESDVKKWLENWALERSIYTTAQLEQMQGR